MCHVRYFFEPGYRDEAGDADRDSTEDMTRQDARGRLLGGVALAPDTHDLREPGMLTTPGTI